MMVSFIPKLAVFKFLSVIGFKSITNVKIAKRALKNSGANAIPSIYPVCQNHTIGIDKAMFIKTNPTAIDLDFFTP